MHLAAIIFGFVFLIVTIPMHIVYIVTRGRSKKLEKKIDRLAKKGVL